MKWFVLALACLPVLSGADWLSAHARSQPDEKELSAESVPGLKLLWTLSLEEPLTAPVVLGPIFTHRGIKELVFVAGATDDLFAIDADLGRLVWKRHFDAPSPGCPSKLTAAPVLAPYYGPAPEGDDAATPRRSLFVLTSDGSLHTVRPADGGDLAKPQPFIPAGSVASDLALKGSTVSTVVTRGCHEPKAGEWSIQVSGPDAKPSVRPGTPELLGPVTANGLTFRAVGSALLIESATTGKQLFRSAPNGPDPVTQSLAIANGHVYLVSGQRVYCYGFPIEI